MIYYIASKFIKDYHIFNLLHYITFRSLCAAITSMILMFVTMDKFITFLKRANSDGQPIRADGPESHFAKKGTPTMGGLLMLMSIFLSCFLWGDLSNRCLALVLFMTFGYGALGFVDDYKKLTKRNSKGVSGKTKLLVQFLLSLIAFYWLQGIMPDSLYNHLAFPIFKEALLDIGLLYFPFIALVTIGSSNAVNLTDGLDGLAIVPIAVALGCFSVISYVVGDINFADYLKLHYVPGSGEISVFCAAAIGAALGFLWYNAPPAEIFMGDTGSLAFGGSLGIISVITKHELVLAIIGGLFVIEAISVIIQVYYFKMTGGKRFFRMAPLHHHFEKLGWSESKIVVRFWIISIVFAMLGMSTLKIR